MNLIDVRDKLLTRAVLEGIRQSRLEQDPGSVPIELTTIEAPCSVAVVLFPIAADAWLIRADFEDGSWVQLGFRPRGSCDTEVRAK